MEGLRDKENRHRGASQTLAFFQVEKLGYIGRRVSAWESEIPVMKKCLSSVAASAF